MALSVDAMHQELSEYRYCTVFVIEGTGLDADGLERDLEALGDSLLAVGDSSARSRCTSTPMTPARR